VGGQIFGPPPVLVGIEMTQLPRNDNHGISVNLLEYAAIILGLAGSITAWDALLSTLDTSRPAAHPMILLWADNSTAKS
jgi:hypothetical protein